jgi:hypothetical protein
MSQIGHPCERCLWFDYNGCEKTTIIDKARLNRIFMMGNLIETETKSLLRGAGYEITAEQLEFKDFDDRFQGHCDGIIHGITSKPHILEIKSASKDNFDLMKKKTVVKQEPKYEAQIHMYMGYANLDRGLFVVYNKNTSEIYTERVHFDKDIFEALKEKARRIIEARAPSEKIKNGCYWCHYKGETCNKDYSYIQCFECKHLLSFQEAPIEQLLKTHNLEGCIVDENHFCSIGKTNIAEDECKDYGQA